MSAIPFTNVITHKEQLSNILGEPSSLAKNKVIDLLDEHCKTYISSSPFLILSTSDSEGKCDSSPRGDAPGFVHVIDEKHLVIPERPGNRRADSLTNILENGHVGLLFMIPGFGETLRVNGKGYLIQDREVLQNMAVNGKVPLLGIAVTVEQAYIHCAKAIKRSNLWEGDKWPTVEHLSSAGKMLKDHANMKDQSEYALNQQLIEGYSNRLY
ncbi:pyridoxamine 5'-phosphate oxidase family protein [Bacillus shivajii]|uniref:pyridoxamine 5'-phosphate oxidase family protein n=1 Tax=Bacillus shivajii TaxID=1983719 RepID=UPI001CF98D86|nr:pyridoxamine 5'-phosphate oxidase family protein [Bacillus shivajii]UCZ53829.1 pyridoxamine 5'-phosphate oxidase family protein [Bacillus shivajii]